MRFGNEVGTLGLIYMTSKGIEYGISLIFQILGWQYFALNGTCINLEKNGTKHLRPFWIAVYFDQFIIPPVAPFTNMV